ncbi:MAG TPA: hypothetical protein VK846_08405 [Candidatus Limnocylindria bacterium]|nr:hypothetical protein [Candidatus Limnocylindria bacterium]
MASYPKAIGDHINAVIAGWEEHATDATFGGLTLTQFKAKMKPSLDARDEVSSLELKLAAARVDRNNADLVSEEITNNVVNSAKGDPSYGENSALYASFGYIRKDDRKSGLTRAANNVVQAPTELKVAA